MPAGNSIIKNEGVKNKAYIDTRGNTTIGIGYNITGNKEQATKDLKAIGADPVKVMSGEAELDDTQVKNLFTISHVRAITGAKQVVKNYDTLPKPAQEALVELTFNLGKTGLASFKETIKLIEANKLKEASKELLDSKWATQVGVDRANEIANKLLTSEPSTRTVANKPLVVPEIKDVKLPEIESNLKLNLPKEKATVPKLESKPIVEPTRLEELVTSLRKEGISNTASQIWNKLTSPDNIEAQKVVIKKEVPLTKQEKKIVDKESVVALGDTLHNYNGDPNRYLVPFRANMKNLTVGVRNRGEKADINTSNALFSTYKPFTHPNNTEEFNFNKFIKVNTKTGKLDVIDRMDFNQYKEADKNEVVLSGTYGHKIKNIDRSVKFTNPGIESNTLGYKTPDNKSQNIKVFGDNLSNSLGGKLLITTPDNKNPKVIYGPANVIAEQIERYKKEYNVDYVWALEADGKAYTQPIQNKNKKITKQQLIALDNKNSAESGSGNIVYIKQ